MQDITVLLNTSVEAIDTLGDAHSKQATVIKNTVSINEDIAKRIKDENNQFRSIKDMAESNANDTAEVASQASIINDMVAEMKQLMENES